MLEHHAHVLANLVDVGAGGGDVLPFEKDLAAGRRFQQIQTAQKGGFAGAGRPDDGNFFAGRDGFGDALQHRNAAEGFGQILNLDHFAPASFPPAFESG